MSLALLLALQAAPPASAEPLRIDFDLAQVKPADPCATGGGGGSGAPPRIRGRDAVRSRSRGVGLRLDGGAPTPVVRPSSNRRGHRGSEFPPELSQT